MSLNKGSFLKHIEETNLFQKNDYLLIAVSGGLDSTTLLYLVRSVAQELNINVSVGHINHQLRDESNQEQLFVENICKGWNVPFYSKELDPSTISKGSSIENWARTERYKALETIRDQIDADWILTAHHGNDQIETLLMHISDGCGLSGLIGIRSKKERIIRPLLPFSKNEIVSYADQSKIPFCEDESNKDLSNPRNFIRHKVVKDWEENSPSIVEGFHRMSQNVDKLIEGYHSLIPWVAESALIEKTEDRIKLSGLKLSEFPLIIQAMIFKDIVGKGKASWRRYRWDDIKSFLETATTGQTFQFDNDWTCLKDRDHWILERRFISNIVEIRVEEDKDTDIGEYSFRWKKIKRPTELNTDSMNEIIDGTFIRNKKLIIRPWKSGDVFIPLGMKGKKKIHDFLVDEKVDLFSKSRQLVLTADDEIIWVCGRRISDLVKVTEKTKEWVKLHLVKKN